MLLSKALKMKQDDEDRKNESIIKGLEDKVKELEDSLKEKDEMLCSAEGSLAEVQAQNKKLGKELADAQAVLKENSNRFNQENEALKATLKVETEKNMKLSEALRALKERCFEFTSQCTARLRNIFNSVESPGLALNFLCEPTTLESRNSCEGTERRQAATVHGKRRSDTAVS
jgi:chromosome segregation ATPase